MIRQHVTQWLFLYGGRADRIFPITGFSHHPPIPCFLPSIINPPSYAPQRPCWLFEVNPCPRCKPKRSFLPRKVILNECCFQRSATTLAAGFPRVTHRVRSAATLK